ncbi:MAG TPA: glycosyltransferase family 2 protein [Candidatus Omnitrophota bacterium]|nr:glycosyltransferase family 2 protein [Candidatus Omnitrophota bacterium]
MKEKVIAVLPAYNAALTLARTIQAIPAGSVDEIILVDDASTDDTVTIARQLRLTVYEHHANKGYGANQKTCYRLALEKGAAFIVMVHPDYQYDSRLIPAALDILRLGVCDVVLGNRVRSRKECLASGMPLYKYLANRFLTGLENICLGQNLGEFHSGFRAYRRAVLQTVPFEKNHDGFVFDTQMLVQAVHFGFTIGDIPMPVRYFPQASSIGFTPSVRYGLQTLGCLLVYFLHRARIVRGNLFTSKKNC